MAHVGSCHELSEYMVMWVCEAYIDYIIELYIQICLAGERTDEGVPRGPRGPKKRIQKGKILTVNVTNSSCTK